MRDFETQKLWPAVTRSIEEALAAHPEAKFFIVFDAAGGNILNGRERWLPRTPESLKELERGLKDSGFSESNFVPGLSRALRTLLPLNDGAALHIYVIGDEFGGRPESVLRQIDEMNPRSGNGKRRATISAFQLSTNTGGTAVKFQAVMTDLTREHSGSFTRVPLSALR